MNDSSIPVTNFLAGIEQGFHELDRGAHERGARFYPGKSLRSLQTEPLPHDVPGPDNDLTKSSTVWFSVPWPTRQPSSSLTAARGDRSNKPTVISAFVPAAASHEVHMNQGNSQQFRESDGVWNDGGLIFHFPEQQQWVAVFTAFQSQSWHTDDATGHALPKPPDQPGNGQGPNVPTPDRPPTEELPDGLLRIVGALVNAVESPELGEFVTILNTSNREIDLAGGNRPTSKSRKCR